MKEHNRLRLERMSARYDAHRHAEEASDDAAFLRAFDEARERVIRPMMEELAVELRKAGHAPRIAIDEAAEKPSIELCLGLKGAAAEAGWNLVGFCVIRWRAVPEVLAYLVVRPPPMDLMRYASPAEIDAGHVEQLLVDAAEHVFACNEIQGVGA
jgi:hypothetical protein